MAVKIRKAKKEDIPALVSLQCEMADYHRKLDRFYKSGRQQKKGYARYLRSEFGKRCLRILVADDGSKIVGYCSCRIEAPRPYAVPKRIGKLQEAFVLPNHRGKGLAKSMVRDQLAWFRRNRLKHVELSVDSRNPLGLAAWHRLGFRERMKKMMLEL